VGRDTKVSRYVRHWAGESLGSKYGVRIPLWLAALSVLSTLAAGESGLFSSYDPIALRIEAPFEDLFAGAKDDPDYAVDGTVSEGAGTAKRVRVALRGHTSRRETECTFPKLKLTAADKALLVGGVRTLKIGTHCGESPDDTLTGRFGRLPNERSPWREAAVYRLLDALQVPALRARPARITYVYTDELATTPRTIERNALLLEDDGEALKRIGADREIEAKEFTTAAAMFTPADAATLAFAEALTGNFDWCVKFTADDAYRCDARLKLWNVIAAARPGDKARPLLHDLDLSGMVAGSHRWFGDVFSTAFVASRSQREVETIAQVQRTRSLFGRAELDAARARFTARKAEAYRTLARAAIDDRGRQQMRDYLDAFYRAIERDEAFYRPVVARPGAVLLPPPPGTTPLCGGRAGIPVGTPVSAPIEVREGKAKVLLLDVLWHWAPPAKCAAVRQGPVWMDQKAIGVNYPAQ